MALFDKFQARVGRDQGANRLFIAAGGFFNLGDVRGGANGVDIDGRALMYAVLSPVTKTSVTLTSVPMAASFLPSYGVVYLWQSVTYNSASMKFPSANLGAILIIQAGMVQSDLQLVASGVSLAGVRNSDLSRIVVTNGSANSAWVELVCFVDGCWSVVSYSNRTGIVEGPSS